MRSLCLLGRVVGVLACAVLLNTCDEGGYHVVILFQPPETAARFDEVEVAFVADCSDLPEPHSAFDEVTRHIELARGRRVTGLGSVDPGTYGLVGRATNACGLAVQGCREVTLEPEGLDELEVVLRIVDNGRCQPGTSCRDGVCVPLTDGDADVDADADADGECDGCIYGADRCFGLGEPAPDNPCRVCRDTTGRPTWERRNVGAYCYDHETELSGQCRGEEPDPIQCCTGCWAEDLGTCRDGFADETCGQEGELCESCLPDRACDESTRDCAG